MYTMILNNLISLAVEDKGGKEVKTLGISKLIFLQLLKKFVSISSILFVCYANIRATFNFLEFENERTDQNLIGCFLCVDKL